MNEYPRKLRGKELSLEEIKKRLHKMEIPINPLMTHTNDFVE